MREMKLLSVGDIHYPLVSNHGSVFSNLSLKDVHDVCFHFLEHLWEDLSKRGLSFSKRCINLEFLTTANGRTASEIRSAK